MRFIGVAGRDGLDAIRDFIDDEDVDAFEHIVDEDGIVWQQFGIASQPAWAFLNQDGEAEVAFGALGEQSLIGRVEDLIAR